MSTLEESKGKTINAVVHNRETICFYFMGGDTLKFEAYGDCCSRSWIEHVEMPNDVEGAVLLDMRDSDRIRSEDIGEDGYELLQVYQQFFVTSRGEIAIEFRNSSNGYYGGWLQEAV